MGKRDVQDGIRTWISVGYRVNEIVLEKESEDDRTPRAKPAPILSPEVGKAYRTTNYHTGDFVATCVENSGMNVDEVVQQLKPTAQQA